MSHPHRGGVYILTPAMLDDASGCGRRFLADRYGANHDRAESASYQLRLGTAAHALAKRVCEQLTAGGTFPDPDEAVSMFFNPTHFATPSEALESRTVLRDMVSALGSFLQEERLTVLAAEKFVQMPRCVVAPNVLLLLRGKIDLVCRRWDDIVLTVDLKTSKFLPDPDELAVRPSSTVYRGLAKQIVGAAANVLICQVLLRSGMAVSVELDEKSVTRARAFIRELVLALDTVPGPEHPMFAPLPGEHCAYCPHQDTCPAWSNDLVSEAELCL